MRVLIILVLLSEFSRQKASTDQKICFCSELDLCCEETGGNCTQTLQQDHIQNGSIIALCSKEIELTTKITFENVKDVLLTGYHINQTKISCSGDLEAGLEISGCQNIKILNVQLSNCGAAHGTKKIASSLYVSNSTSITIQDVHVISSRGKGLIMLNSYGNVDNCLFQDNKNTQGQSHHSVYGGGMYVELNDAFQHENVNLSLTVNNCIFLSNEISFLNGESRRPNDVQCNSDTDFQGLHTGGGIAIFLRGQVEGATVTVRNVQIERNKAVWGGGMYVHFCNQAQQNKVYIENVNISENSCELYGGGGIDIGFTYENTTLNTTMHNSLEFHNCRFDLNRAFFGGGVALYTEQSDFEHNASVTFSDCSWLRNSAHYGAAIDMAPLLIRPSLHVHMPKITFKNVKFEDNVVETNGHRFYPLGENTEYFYGSRPGLGRGTFLVAGLKVDFEGNVSLINNTGSAIYAISSILNLAEGTDAHFTRNTGFNGGAIALAGFSAILVNDNVTVSMINNSAHSRGGAIYHKSIDQHDYLFSRNCFIQKYDNETSGVVFHFIGNHAGQSSDKNSGSKLLNYGDSIFATTLQPCFEYCGLASHSDTFRCIGTFHYHDQNESVATSGAYFSSNISQPFPIVPGKETEVPFKLQDDLDQQVRGLYHVASNNLSLIYVDDIHTYTSGNTFILGGEPGSTETITITKIGQRKVSFTFEVKLEECPPFFRYNNSLKKCICANNVQADYQNIIICNPHTEFTTSLLHGYWAGYDDEEGKTGNFKYGLCPKNYCFHGKERERHHKLPPRKKALEEEVCGETRSGVLCGKCRDNYCAHYHSNNFECDTCTTCNYGWVFYILSELIPLAILFLVVVIFNISFTSGLLNGFIFYAQVFDSIFSIGKSFIWYPRPTYTLTRIIQVVYKFFNFDFFGDDQLAFCLWKRATTLELLAFRFLTVAIAGLLVVSTILLMKRCAYSKLFCSLKASPSMIHGLSAFLVMVYTQCTKISFQLLDYSRVLDLDGNTRRVLYYQGDMVYFSINHIPFAILAISCLSTLTLLPPLLLISYPLCYRLSSLLKLDNTKFSKILGKLIPLSKMKPVFDSFQGCFKDKYRHFAGLYFVYRVALLASVLTSDPILTNTMTQVLLIFMLTIHCICWPYVRRLHNTIDGLILANLTLINSFTLFNYHYAQVGSTYQDTINISTSIQIVFIYAPFSYFLGITIFALVKMRKMKKDANSVDDDIMLERLDCPDEDKEFTSSYRTLSVTY